MDVTGGRSERMSPSIKCKSCTLQVRASADDAKRGFLERKGLTAAEIAEAFSRVSSLPAPPPPAAPAPYSTGLWPPQTASQAPDAVQLLYSPDVGYSVDKLLLVQAVVPGTTAPCCAPSQG